MNKDTRISDVLHVLLHMEKAKQPLTSEVLGRSMGTNPAVLRRTMAGLRDAGLVYSGNGRGGGWKLALPLSQITLLSVYEALGKPNFFAIGNRSRHPECSVEKNVNLVLADAIKAAESLLVARFGEITLEAIDPHHSNTPEA